MDVTYPSEPGEAGLALFLRWFGRHYARSTSLTSVERHGSILRAAVVVGRQWTLDLLVIDSISTGATISWEAARAIVERRLDASGLRVGLWVPRGAQLPREEPGLSALAIAVEEARDAGEGRQEAVLPVELFLKRTSTTGSVVTILGGLAAHWARFTNRVPGSFQLNSIALHRLPAAQEARDELAERVVLAAGQPEADESQTISAEDCWTVTALGGERSFVLGTPLPENDEQSAAFRRGLRSLLREAASLPRQRADARALAMLSASTYAEEEKVGWALRGMDPSLYAGFDILVTMADGVVKPLLQPGRATLPRDAPVG